MSDTGGRPPTKSERQKAAADASEAFREPDPPKQGAKLEKIMIVLLILLLLAGAAAAGYYFFLYDPATQSEETEKTEADSGPPRAAEGPAIYASVPNLMVPVLGPEGPEAVVQINLRVQVANEGYMETLQDRGQLAQDLLNQAVYGYVNDSYEAGQTRLDLTKLEAEMEAALKERFGDSAIVGVNVLGLEQRSADPREGAG